METKINELPGNILESSFRRLWNKIEKREIRT